MRIISRKTLRQFWQKSQYADAEQPLKAWFREASKADWATPAEIKAVFRTASIVRNNRVVFNICGNKYRLIVTVNYAYRVIYIRFIGTHAQYDRINVEEV
jgi:mRNA interferase HigB